MGHDSKRMIFFYRTNFKTRLALESLRGFTLVEMLIVVIILGILTAIAAPAFSQWRAHSATNNAASSIMAHLKQARNLAVSENRRVRVTFAATTYIFDQDTTGNCNPCRNLTMQLSQYSNNLSASTTATGDIFTFGSTGTGSTGTVTITDSADTSYCKKVTVNMIGRAYWKPRPYNPPCP